ncbi:MAG: hypothetical protein IJN37_02080 [Clostridia bacterium]|nr:hypothetical protein [Clostridia bacterium]
MVNRENKLKKLLRLTKIVRNLLIVIVFYILINNHNATKKWQDYEFKTDKNTEILYDNTHDFETKVDRYNVSLECVQAADDGRFDGKKRIKMMFEIKAFDIYKQYLDLEHAMCITDDMGNSYYLNDFAERERDDSNAPVNYAQRRGGSWKRQLYLTIYVPYEASELTVLFDRFGHSFEVTTPVSGGEKYE